jgi:uncharacterized protein YcfL
MKYKIILLLFCLLLVGCSKKIYQPVEVQTKIVEKEILVRDTVVVELPVEVIKEVVPQMDTSTVETSVAKATGESIKIARNESKTKETAQKQLFYFTDLKPFANPA